MRWLLLVSMVARADEFAMALSAAPEHLREGAGVWVHTEKGLEKKRESSNSFHCLVLRSGGESAPICYDAEGARTTMMADIREAELAAKGMKPEEIRKTIEGEYKSGALRAPQRAGVAYMLSPHFTRTDSKTGKTSQVFPPHIMFYAPYLTNKDIGVERKAFGSTAQPWILGEGTPRAYIIVVPHH